jgi:hypothetical protein
LSKSLKWDEVIQNCHPFDQSVRLFHPINEQRLWSLYSDNVDTTIHNGMMGMRSMHNLRKRSLGWFQGRIWVSLPYYYLSPWYMCFTLSLSEISHLYLFNQFETAGSAPPQIRTSPLCRLPIHHANCPDVFALTVL